MFKPNRVSWFEPTGNTSARSLLSTSGGRGRKEEKDKSKATWVRTRRVYLNNTKQEKTIVVIIIK